MSSSQRDQVRALFDLVADQYANVEFFKPLGRDLVDFAAVPPGSTALDVCAGRGAVTRPLAEAVGSSGLVVAADLSSAMTIGLQSDLPPAAEVHCLQADAAALPLATCTVDAVLAGFAIHILFDPALALREIARVLRPGGVLAFSTPGPSDRPAIPGYAEAIEMYAQRASPDVWSMRPPPDLLAAVHGAGFVDVTECSATVSVPITDPDAFLTAELSHGFRGWVDALSSADRAGFLATARDALHAQAATGALTMDRGARLMRAMRPS